MIKYNLVMLQITTQKLSYK